MNAGARQASEAGGGPEGMSRRQLLRHTAWFGSAVVLTVTGGEVISHIAGAEPAGPPDATALRFV